MAKKSYNKDHIDLVEGRLPIISGQAPGASSKYSNGFNLYVKNGRNIISCDGLPRIENANVINLDASGDEVAVVVEPECEKDTKPKSQRPAAKPGRPRKKKTLVERIRTPGFMTLNDALIIADSLQIAR